MMTMTLTIQTDFGTAVVHWRRTHLGVVLPATLRMMKPRAVGSFGAHDDVVLNVLLNEQQVEKQGSSIAGRCGFEMYSLTMHVCYICVLIAFPMPWFP